MHRPSTAELQLLGAFATQVAQALTRAHLTQRLEEARVAQETERLRSALLSSVSHGLRTPLSSIIGAALRRTREMFPDVAIERAVPPDLPLLSVHAALVEQALVNVMENAARVTPGGASLSVTAAVDEQLLQRLRAGDAPVPAIVPQEMVREILEDLGYVESDVEVRLG